MPAIRISGLGKKYRIGKTVHTTLRDHLAAFFKRANDRIEDFWALKDVSFDVQQGDVFGVIGRNGAGKSTLLKLLSQISEPTEGEVRIRGRVASLLEVGTGFHPELSGRENIFLNGAILGMSRSEIRRKFDEIVAFAEVERFLDLPVKRYSSGMYVRLAFAVAAHLDPEILVVDEVLAVGDIEFQRKCLGKIEEVANSARTVLLVSHNLAVIQQLARSAVLLDRGHLISQGVTSKVIEDYQALYGNRTFEYSNDQLRRWSRSDTATIEIVRVTLANNQSNLLSIDESLITRFTVHARETVSSFRFNLTISTLDGMAIGSCFGPSTCSIRQGEEATFEAVFANLRLAPGKYQCAVGVGVGDNFQAHRNFDAVYDVLHFEVMAPLSADGVIGTWHSSWGSTRLSPPEVHRL